MISLTIMILLTVTDDFTDNNDFTHYVTDDFTDDNDFSCYVSDDFTDNNDFTCYVSDKFIVCSFFLFLFLLTMSLMIFKNAL